MCFIFSNYFACKFIDLKSFCGAFFFPFYVFVFSFLDAPFGADLLSPLLVFVVLMFNYSFE